jgi:hypothetical protein
MHFLENKFNELVARYEELLRFELDLQNRERNVELQATQLNWMNGFRAGRRGGGGHRGGFTARGRGRGGGGAYHYQNRAPVPQKAATAPPETPIPRLLEDCVAPAAPVQG